MSLYVQAEYGRGRHRDKVVGWRKSRATTGHSAFVKWKIATFPEEYNPNDWYKVYVYDRLCNLVESRPWCPKNYVEAYYRELDRMSARGCCQRHRTNRTGR